MGHQPRQRARSANLALGAGSNSGYSPDAPLFSAPDVAHVTVRWAFRRLLRHRIRNTGGGGEG